MCVCVFSKRITVSCGVFKKKKLFVPAFTLDFKSTADQWIINFNQNETNFDQGKAIRNVPIKTQEGALSIYFT